MPSRRQSRARPGSVPKNGEAGIKRKVGRVFLVRPHEANRSPLDVTGLNLGLTARQIVRFIHEGRRKAP